MSARKRIAEFIDLWDERRAKGGQYTDDIYGLGTHDETVVLKASDVRVVLDGVAAVLDLHRKTPARYYGTDLNPDNEFDCLACGEGRPWPCYTVRALTTEQEHHHGQHA